MLMHVARGATPPSPEAVCDELRTLILSRDQAASTYSIVGLRRLNDQSLAPLFARFARASSATFRLQGVLGEAELAGGQLDLLALRRLTDSTERMTVLHEVIEADLVGTEQLEDIARWPELSDRVYVEVCAALTMVGRTPPTARLAMLATAEGPGVNYVTKLHAALVLCQLAPRDTSARRARNDALGMVLSGKPTAERNQEVERQRMIDLLDRCRRMRLPSGRELGVEILVKEDADALLRHHALRLVLTLRADDRAAEAACERAFSKTSDVGERMRTAVAVMDGVLGRAEGVGISSSICARMVRDENEVIAAMGRAIDAMRTGKKDVADALCELIRTGEPPHPSSASWALKWAQSAPEPAATKVRRAVLENAVGGMARAAGGGGQVPDAAVEAAAAMIGGAELDSMFTAALADPAAGRTTLRAILMGAVRSVHPEGVKLALRLDEQWPDEGCQALAALVRARLPGPLEPQILQAIIERLSRGALASTDRGLGPEFRAKCAWLSLKLAGQERVALARLIGSVP